MIKFKGQISDESKKKIKKFQIASSIKYTFFIGFPLAIPIVVTLYLIMANTVLPGLELRIFVAVSLAFLAAMIPISFALYTCDKVVSQRYAKLIKFSYNTDYENEFFYIDGLGQKFYKYTIDVSKVLDLGDVYIIVFSSLLGTAVLFQKDLLVEGTIEEFEKLFEGKIIVK